MEHSSSQVIIFGMDIEDAKFEIQEKIGEFFENSAMDDRLIRFDNIQNEIDNLRMSLFNVKEMIESINNTLNPPKSKPPIKGKIGGVGVKGKTVIKPRTGSVITYQKKSNSVEKKSTNKTANTTASSSIKNSKLTSTNKPRMSSALNNVKGHIKGSHSVQYQ